MKRCWQVILPGYPIFTMVMMEDGNPLEIVQSIWGMEAMVE